VGIRTVGGAPRGFSTAIEVTGPQRTLHISGQVGTDANGHTPGNIEAQCHIVWDKIEQVLQEGNMTMKDVIKTTVLLTSADDVDAFRKVRAQRLGDNVPASTLMVITALARPGLKVEVEAIASRDA
jgi:2-iminobutanoate/2-iminopropanoate deaminase